MESDTKTEEDARKSMDDVLASIRRIVRAEREGTDDGPVDADVIPDSDPDGDVPLALTPDMMSEAERAGDAAAAPPAAAKKTGEPTDRTVDVARFVKAPEPPDDLVPAAAAPGLDEDQIRDLIREVVAEELKNGAAEGLVREIIKAELTTGEIGANISRNVLRLIRSEVAKANG